jgi:glycosyltransferase involved in cell wall biosynthesis
MNILHIDLGTEMRGGQHQVVLLMRELARHRHKQLLLTAKSSPLLKIPNLDARPIGARLPSGFDLIHAHDARAHTRALTSRVPLVVSRRVAFPVKRGALSRWKYRRATHFIAVSQFVARRLIDAGVPESKITVIFDGVEMPSAPAPRASGDFTVGAIAAPPEKPQHLLPRGVVILDPAQLPGALAGIDALVYLSNSEGLGSGILMAMAYGLPVIASDIGGIPEIVAPGRTGLLVPNTTDAVKRVIDELAADRVRARTMGAAGRAWVAANATGAIMAAKTERVYRAILE